MQNYSGKSTVGIYRWCFVLSAEKKEKNCGEHPVESIICQKTIIILVFGESGYSQLISYTPANSSSKCIAIPPTIRRTHPTTGIADIPNTLLIADSPIHPKNPNTIIMVGGVLATTIAMSFANISQPPLKKFFRQRDGSSFYYSLTKISNDNQNLGAGFLPARSLVLDHYPYLAIHPFSRQDSYSSCFFPPKWRPNYEYNPYFLFLESASKSLYMYHVYLLLYLKILKLVNKIIEWETISSIEGTLNRFKCFFSEIVSHLLLFFNNLIIKIYGSVFYVCKLLNGEWSITDCHPYHSLSYVSTKTMSLFDGGGLL